MQHNTLIIHDFINEFCWYLDSKIEFTKFMGGVIFTVPYEA